MHVLFDFHSLLECRNSLVVEASAAVDCAAGAAVVADAAPVESADVVGAETACSYAQAAEDPAVQEPEAAPGSSRS